MNISKLCFITSIICLLFPVVSFFVLRDAPDSVSYIFEFLGSQLKLTVIAFVLFYAHKVLEKKMWA